MSTTEFLADSALALLLGSLIGLERQIRQHPAGLRTNALVCVGAALFVAVSRLAGDTNSPTRVASYVVSGVGFLGGGVILREGLHVKGIDTAATLWCSAAAGVLAGMGFPAEAAIGAGLILGINLGVRPLARRIDARAKAAGGETTYQLRVVCVGKQRGDVRDEVRRRVAARPGWQAGTLKVKHSKRRKRASLVLAVTLPAPDDKAVEALEAELELRTGVLAVE
ncbi:MAG TPA: MgtC/SapB family protein, partial [Urbifossiella sp.]|nr:MgtC/SapB family protein [Urbifossiella sp.]